MVRFVCTAALALGLLVNSASDSSAASYGNFSSGTGTVSFLNVADLNGLYGMPTVSGNSLDFNPNAFEADCSVDPGCPPTPADATDTLTLQVDASAGNFIEDIMLSEAGDTTLAAFGAAFAATTITADVFVDVLEINGSSVNNVNANAVMVFTQNGEYETDDEGTGTFIWTGMLMLDIDAVIAGAGEVGQATLVELSISNTLTAFAESGASARIEKKDIDGLAITVIPEPGTALLMGFGLMGLAAVKRR